MKYFYYLFSILLTIIVPPLHAQKSDDGHIVIDTTFTFSMNEFEFYDYGDDVWCIEGIDHKRFYWTWIANKELVMVACDEELCVPDDLDYVGFDCQYDSVLVADNFVLIPSPYFPTEASIIGGQTQINFNYSLNWYPPQQVYTFGEWITIRGGHRYQRMSVLPFRYDAWGQKLYLCSKIHISVKYSKSTDGIDDERNAHSSALLTPWYTLSGRHLPALPTQKGIYIKDGRQVLIK